MPLTGPGTNSFPGNGVIIIDETPIVGGTDGYVLYDNNGVVGVEAGGGGGTITEGTTPTSGFTDGYAITSSGGFVGQAQIRTILTGNLNLYVNAATGSDSYNGLSATFTGGVNGPWATLQHAMDVIASTFDFAGFLVTGNIAAGTYVGFGVKSTVGGGILQWQGAGSASTVIDNGPNDGLFNSGEAVSIGVPLSCVFQINGCKFQQSVAVNTAAVANYNPGNLLFFGGFTTLDIAFDISNSGSAVEMSGASLFQTAGGGGGISVGGTGNPDSLFELGAGACMFDAAAWTIGGSLTWAIGALECLNTSSYISEGASYSGSATGPEFSLLNCSAAGGFGGALGANFFPGSTQGVTDEGSTYDGVSYTPAINTQTASYQLVWSDAGGVVEMNAAGANNLTIPANATVPFPLQTRIDITQLGAGTTTVVAAGGVTLLSAGGKVNIAGQYSGATIYQRAANVWVLIGELA